MPSFNSIPKVLIVDDNAINRQVLVFAMKRLGFEILQAANGQEALDIYRINRCELVLMDLMMPVMDGIDATRGIRAFELNNNLKKSLIIAVSAHVQLEEMEVLTENNLFDFVARKPLDYTLLKNILSSRFDLTNV